MRGIGSSFNSRLRAMRDFEQTEKTAAFLSIFRYQNYVDVIGPGLYRLNESAEQLITESIVNVFYEDYSKYAEDKFTENIQRELKTVEGNGELRIALSFRPNEEKTMINVIAYLSMGPASIGVRLFSDFSVSLQMEIEELIAQYPHLTWVLNASSPLYMREAVENLRMHLMFKGLASSDFSRDVLKEIRAAARKLVARKTKASENVPPELNSCAKKIMSLIKSLSNTVTPEINSSHHYSSTERSEEHQVIITAVSNGRGFTVAIGIKTDVGGTGEVSCYAIGIRMGVMPTRWPDLFSERFIKDELEADVMALKYALLMSDFRHSSRKHEEVYMAASNKLSIAERVGLMGSDVVVEFRKSIPLELSSINLDGVIHQADLLLNSIFEFCERNKIVFEGGFSVATAKEGLHQARLPSWKVSIVDGLQRSDSVKPFETLQFEGMGRIVLSSRSSLELLDQLNDLISRLGYPRLSKSAV